MEILERSRTLYAARQYAMLAEFAASLPPETLTEEPEFGFHVADAWRRIGRSAEAIELVRALAQRCDARGNDRLFRDRLNLEGILLFELGKIDDAELSWRELLDAASRAADEDFVARANNNLGVIYTLHGRPAEALASYERAIAAHRIRGYRRGLAQAHQNLAITYREIGFENEADAHFRRVISYARTEGNEDEVARAEQERALLIYYFRRDAALARATATRALQRFQKLGLPVGVADVERVLGVISLGERRVSDSRDHFQEALRVARETHTALLEAETLLGLAALSACVGDTAESAALEAQATSLFATLGATGWGEQTRRRLFSLAPAQEQN